MATSSFQFDCLLICGFIIRFNYQCTYFVTKALNTKENILHLKIYTRVIDSQKTITLEIHMAVVLLTAFPSC